MDRHANPSPEVIAALLLQRAATIAVIGLSTNPRRPSFGVARALQSHGHRIVPVNPVLREWQGLPAYPSLGAAVAAMGPAKSIDLVDVFRRAEHVAGIVDECIALRIPALWLQLDVVDHAAALRAERAGITVVMDRCIKVDRAALG
jgi:uncharacterized protein